MSWQATSAQTFIGQASVVDSGTIEIHGTLIWIWGVDAVESSQLCYDENAKAVRCGAKAANALASFIATRVVQYDQVSCDNR